MDFVLCERNKFGRPTVASMSLGGGISPPLDAAAQKVRQQFLYTDDELTTL
jgi:hypothetical protein